jgi:hypothetical protein
LFTFGDPADAARLYLDDVMNTMPGPKVSDVHHEELEWHYLVARIAWIKLAFVHAARNDADEPILQALLDWFDEIFEYMCEINEDFRQRMIITPWRPPQGFEFREKYVEIARRYSES